MISLRDRHSEWILESVFNRDLQRFVTEPIRFVSVITSSDNSGESRGAGTLTCCCLDQCLALIEIRTDNMLIMEPVWRDGLERTSPPEFCLDGVLMRQAWPLFNQKCLQQCTVSFYNAQTRESVESLCKRHHSPLKLISPSSCSTNIDSSAV